MALSQLDQIKKTEDGIRRLRESIPGPAYDPSDGAAVSAPPPRAVVSAQPVLPKRSFPTQVGQYAQGRVNSMLHGAEKLTDTVAYPLRRGLGAARDAFKGFTGAANPDEGKLAGENSYLPRVGGARSPNAPANFSGVTASVSQTPARPAPAPAASTPSAPAPATPATPAATANAPVANAVQNNGLPAGITRTVGPDGNPIYSGTGASVAAAGGPPQGATVTGQPTSFAMPQRTLPQDVLAPANQAGQYQARGRQGGIIENPANGSIADQIARAVGSPSLKGSPSARAAVAQAILQQAGFANDERQSALRTGDQADLQNLNNAANANENFARRRFDASKFNVESADKRTQNAAENSQATQIVRGLDGSSSVVRKDGSLSGLTNADGTAFQQAPDASQRTTVSPDAEFKALSDELTALSQAPPVEGDTRAAQIQARMAQLTGQGGAPSPPTVGTVKNGYRFKGGNPADAASWEKTK